jgi:hypothetical protein
MPPSELELVMAAQLATSRLPAAEAEYRRG